MRLEDQLTRTITEHVSTVFQPVPDLSDVVTRGRGMRRRRTATVLAAIAVLAMGAAMTLRELSGRGAPDPGAICPGRPAGLLGRGCRWWPSPNRPPTG